MSQPTVRTFQDIRKALLEKTELALVDVCEEAVFATGHPLFAVNIPLSRLELEVYARIPRRDTAITLYDRGDGLALRAARRLRQLGYTDTALLENGLEGWQQAGGELFIDVNVPSKAFGELVENRRHTPSLEAHEVKALLDSGANSIILDARRFDEYQTMSIPGAISVPGAELVLRARALAPDPSTRIIVNCAGRTRSIIGTQSLINAGIPNPVAALRNGTIGWTLAGLHLEHDQQRRFPLRISSEQQQAAAHQARQVADRAAVGRAVPEQLSRWQSDSRRTLYCFDVRTEEEYTAGHLLGFRPVPGGQLVQETDHFASVRGARIVLADTDDVRANMTGSWLAQMGWDVWVLDGLSPADFSKQGPWSAPVPPAPAAGTISPDTLQDWLADRQTRVLDFTASANYVHQHIPGAWWVLRAQLTAALERIPQAARYVLTCSSSLLARYAAEEVHSLTGQPVFVLEGGTTAWLHAGKPAESGETALAVPRTDRYRRPYEGTDNPGEAMQAYLDWEFGLVEQLARDATHGFRVLE